MTKTGKQILLTTFEPSGDALAAGVVRKMKQQMPDLQVYAMGGPKLEAAGAVIIEQTTQHATMGLSALAQFSAHKKRLKRLKQWLTEHPIDLLIPVDSPAANWSICKTVRKKLPGTSGVPGAGIRHLVAPQIWAWATWRIRRLRKWSDGVLCLLPFEPDWFEARGVKAQFIGHPVFDCDCHAPGSDEEAKGLPQADLKLILLPGSRTGEIAKNWPTMVLACRELLKRHDNLQVIVAALDQRLADMIKQLTTKAGCDALWQDRLMMSIGQTESVLRWSDVALAASGTVTLQIATHGKPMVAMYNTSRLLYQTLGRLLVAQHTFTLPNLISEWQSNKRVITELVPHFGQVPPVVQAVDELLCDESKRQKQQDDLSQVIRAFEGKQFSTQAANALLAQL